MCGINPMGGLLTRGGKGRAAALGGVAGAMIAGGKKDKSTPRQAAATPTAQPTAGFGA